MAGAKETPRGGLDSFALNLLLCFACRANDDCPRIARFHFGDVGLADLIRSQSHQPSFQLQILRPPVFSVHVEVHYVDQVIAESFRAVNSHRTKLTEGRRGREPCIPTIEV
jgi:hypothetical protein